MRVILLLLCLLVAGCVPTHHWEWYSEQGRQCFYRCASAGEQCVSQCYNVGCQISCGRSRNYCLQGCPDLSYVQNAATQQRATSSGQSPNRRP